MGRAALAVLPELACDGTGLRVLLDVEVGEWMNMRPSHRASGQEALAPAIRFHNAHDLAVELGRPPPVSRTVTLPKVLPQPVWVLTTERT